MALVHSEGGEATEALRDGKPALYGQDGKPEGVAVEVADIAIRLMDACEHFNVPLCEEWATLADLPNKATPPTDPIERIGWIHVAIPNITIEEPDWTAAEAVECIERCEAVCQSFGVDLWMVIETKHAFNLTRPYKHGRGA